jgi:hypothetical protein
MIGIDMQSTGVRDTLIVSQGLSFASRTRQIIDLLIWRAE